MSTFDAIIYQTLCDSYDYTRHYVRTSIIAGRLGKNDRIIRRSLANLEAAGFVKRRGQRGGWMPTTTLRIRNAFTFSLPQLAAV